MKWWHHNGIHSTSIHNRPQDFIYKYIKSVNVQHKLEWDIHIYVLIILSTSLHTTHARTHAHGTSTVFLEAILFVYAHNGHDRNSKRGLASTSPNINLMAARFHFPTHNTHTHTHTLYTHEHRPKLPFAKMS